MRWLLATAICFVAHSTTALSDAGFFYAYGIGKLSCANWLSQPENTLEGQAWLFGYWSGLNRMNPQNSSVGSRSDPPGIVGEIEKICRAEPSTGLYEAVQRVYDQFSQTGK